MRLTNRSLDLYARIVLTPVNVSLKCENTGDLVAESSLAS